MPADSDSKPHEFTMLYMKDGSVNHAPLSETKDTVWFMEDAYTTCEHVLPVQVVQYRCENSAAWFVGKLWHALSDTSEWRETLGLPKPSRGFKIQSKHRGSVQPAHSLGC